VDSELWKPSTGWDFSSGKSKNAANIFMVNLKGEWFMGYNPFGMANVLHDREWLDIKKARMTAYFKRRGMLFLDGVPATQMDTPRELADAESPAYWIEHNGMRIHLKLPEGKKPSDYLIEATNKEQIFAPETYGLAYIKVKGITFEQAGNGFPVPQRGMFSATRGNHWIIEDCTFSWANSLGIDLGKESWGTVDGFPEANHVFRRNIVKNCGISGLQVYIAKSVLVEDNLFENIGWQNAEHAFESGAIKFHQANNCLIRRNVFRNIVYAPGIWLDYMSNKNCRITKNVFADITTARGGIYIEVSHNDCLVDHNFFYKTHSQYWLSGEYGAGGDALYTDGSDSIRFENNLVYDIEGRGYGSYLNAERMVGTRGGITRDHSVQKNIFAACGKLCIEFANEYSFADYNVFCNPKPGYIKIGNPAPALLIDFPSTTRLYKWNAHSRLSKLELEFDVEKLTLKILKADEADFEMAGPFNKLKKAEIVNIDPRMGLH